MMRLARLFIAVSALSLAAVAEARAATFIITSTADAVDATPGDGVCATAAATCTLRAAIQETNALIGADSITLPAGMYSLSTAGAGEDAAATGDLDITGDLTITGATNGQTIVSAGGIDRVFDIIAPATATLSRLTIQNGFANGADGSGGGIRTAGTLTLTLATIKANTATVDGGGLAIRSGGAAQLTNVTVTLNGASARGGGIANVGGSLQLVNVTVSGNAATQGGGLDNFGSAQAVNTIVANSLTGSTCAGGEVASLGHNLDSGTTCLFSGMGDLQNKDPKLGSLLDTGSTFVLPLQLSSPAIDAGDNVNCPPTDQRGQLRPADGNNDGLYLCDIGAYEVAGPVLPTPTASATGTATNTPPQATPNTPTPTGTPVGGSISLSKVNGHPGEQVVFTATLSTKGASVARTQNDIAFDAANAPIAALPNAAPDCTVNAQLLKEAASFAFQPGGCSGAACTSVHAAVLSTMNTNPIPDGSVLYTCKVNVAANAGAGQYLLTISGVVLEDPNGQPLPSPIGSSGAIVVVVPPPTRTPGPADCCQCNGPPVCGPASGGCGSCVVVFGATCDGASGQCMVFTVTPTASVTTTATPTPTVTRTGTSTPTLTATSTATHTPVLPTPTVTATPATAVPTDTTTQTATATAPPTNTHSPSASPTLTPTLPPPTTTGTEAPSTTATVTPTGTPTLAVTSTATATTIPSPTATDTVTATQVPTPTPTLEVATATGTPTASHTPVPTATATVTQTESPTPSPTPPVCTGDCDHSGDVTITDIVIMVNIALESTPVTACTAGDVNGDGQITVVEIIIAVGNTLSGCPAT
jgi:CSLREA domain-containing protein